MSIIMGRLAKGLREPCPPYREIYVFGAEPGTFNADGWNCLPEAVEDVNYYDLSAIPRYKEVCVALCRIENTTRGWYYINFRWVKERTGETFYEYTFSFFADYDSWLYAYSYVGYFDWEISEDGNYRVDITVSGAESAERPISFVVAGTRPPAEEPIPGAEPVTAIVGFFNKGSTLFYNIYLEVLGWVWPFWLIADFFYALAVVFNNLAWAFYQFNEWVVYVSDRVTTLINWVDIDVWFASWAQKITEAYNWVSQAWWNVTGIIDDWWSVVGAEIQSIIDSAVNVMQQLISQVDSELTSLINSTAWTLQQLIRQVEIPLRSLQASWSNFTFYTLPNLATLTNVDALIDTWFKNFSTFWEGWQDWRDSVAEFFADPLQWLYTKMDEFFERFW